MTTYWVVSGTPVAQPRPRFSSAGGFVRAYTQADHPVVAWRKSCANASRNHSRGPIYGPVAISLTFIMPRPASHYGTGRNAGTLKASAPSAHIKTPDIDNLTKAVLDAMTAAGAWHDDAQISEQSASKRYACPMERPGCLISVTDLDQRDGKGVAK